MPQIKEYQQHVEANAGVPESRVHPDAFDPFPRNAASGINDLASVLQVEQEKDDTANVHVMMAQARADWTNHLNQTAQKTSTDVSMSSGQVTVGSDDPSTSTPVPIVNVGNFADKYMGDLSNYLTDAKKNVTTNAGSRLYDTMAANLHADMQEKSTAYQAHLTGLKAVADYNGALNNYRNVLLNDPSQFQSVLKEASTGLGSWVDIPADQRIKLMEQTSEKLALSAVQGQIKIDPDGALKQLNEGQWDNYLSGNGKTQLLHQAQLGINAQYVEQARIARGQEALEQKVRTQVNDGFMGKFVSGELSMKDVLDSNLKPFGEGSKESWRALIEKQNADGLKPVKTDAAWFQDTFYHIHLPAGDPNKMTNEDGLNGAFVDGKVNRTDLDFLRKEVQADRTPDGQRLNEQKANFFKMAQKQFDKSTLMGNDPVGAEQAYKFQMYVESLIADARAKKENEYDLFNPKSKSYVGQYIPQFQRSIQEQVQDIQKGVNNQPGAQTTLPDTDKRLPGETPEAWRKRTGR